MDRSWSLESLLAEGGFLGLGLCSPAVDMKKHVYPREASVGILGRIGTMKVFVGRHAVLVGSTTCLDTYYHLHGLIGEEGLCPSLSRN